MRPSCYRIRTLFGAGLLLMAASAVAVEPPPSRSPADELWSAVDTGDVAGAEASLGRGAAVDTPYDGRTPLMAAVEAGNGPLAKALLARGANLEAKHALYGSTALITAVLHSQEAMVDLLLLAGANPNAKDNRGFTPMIYAAARSQTATVERLLAAGARLDERDPSGGTALWYAAGAGDKGTVRALLAAGADRGLTGNCINWNQPACRADELARHKGFREIAAMIEAGALPPK